MSKTSPIPIFDAMPHDAKAYSELWRENNPNYGKEWRKKQKEKYGDLFLREERAYHKKWYDSLSEEKKKEYDLKKKLYNKNWKKKNRKRLAACSRERYAGLSLEQKADLSTVGKEKYKNISPEKKEEYLKKHRIADKTRYRLKKLKEAHAKFKKR